MGESNNLRDLWNQLSAPYQRNYPLGTQAAHYGPLCPDEAQLQLLGDVDGLRIAEVGCGGGQCSIAFGRQGAVVVGIDISDAQVAYARWLAADAGVSGRFVQGDAHSLPLPTESQDMVFSACASAYWQDLDACCAEMYRVLVPGGRALLSEVHPFSLALQEEDNRAWLAYSYFMRGREDWEWEFPEDEITVAAHSFNRTVGDMVTAFGGAGFCIRQLLEPEPTDLDSPWAGDYPPPLRQVPTTLIIVAVKPE